MSYMRGLNYLWRDDERIHLWISDGYDGWDESVWGEGRGGSGDDDSSPGRSPASGVGVAQEVMDEYVVMRFAELIEQGAAVDVIDRALGAHAGNGGCGALEKSAPGLRELIESFRVPDNGPL